MAKIGRADWRRGGSRHVAKRRCPCCACVRAVHVCSAFKVVRFIGDMRQVPWALSIGDIDSNLICLESREGEILWRGRFDGCLGKFHGQRFPMVGSEMTARRSTLYMPRALVVPKADVRCVMNRQKGHRAIATRTSTGDIGEASVLSCAHARDASSITKRAVVVASSEGEDHGTTYQLFQRAFAV